MEWLSSIRQAIEYTETHLSEDITPGQIAGHVSLSPLFLSKGFSVMTGMTLNEYIRNRRLYLAALMLRNTDRKVIDIALDCFYETPESFTKAFTRFHGSSPSRVRSGAPFKSFLPISLKISIQGGDLLDASITRMLPFTVIGFERQFSEADALEKIPAFWDELYAEYAACLYQGKEPENPYEKALSDNHIGEYGICIDTPGCDTFRYLIAGRYAGGEVPEGMTLYSFPLSDWAVFNCTGPLPDSLQSMTARVFTEWLPGNPDCELSGNASVEWYDCVNGSPSDPDYHSAVWIPVRKKE